MRTGPCCHHTRLVAAAAAARSGFPLALRPDALGNADPLGTGALEACLTFGSVLGIAERRLDAAAFTGELPALLPPGFNVTGGGGSGRGRTEDKDPEVLRLGPGDPVATGGLDRGFILVPVMK